jgi:hypothetical protein
LDVAFGAPQLAGDLGDCQKRVFFRQRRLGNDVVRAQGFHRTPAFLMQLHAQGGGMVLRAMARRGMVTKIITMQRMIIATNPVMMADRVVI